MRASPLTYASLVLTAFFWGSAFNVGAHVIASMSPISAGTERFLIASVALLALLACTGRLDWRLARRHLPALAAVGVLGVAGFNLSRTVAPESIDDVVNLLIPVLQEKGAYKTSYADGTYRDKLFGHARLPSTHSAAQYRGGAAAR